MFLSDSVRFDSHGTQMPLEIDVTTLLDELVRAATICWLPSITGPWKQGAAQIHCMPQFISPGIWLEVSILPFLFLLCMLDLFHLNCIWIMLFFFKNHLSFWHLWMQDEEWYFKVISEQRMVQQKDIVDYWSKVSSPLKMFWFLKEDYDVMWYIMSNIQWVK